MDYFRSEMNRIRTHHVHAGQLRPNLGEQANMSAIYHMWFEQLQIGDIRIIFLEFTYILDLLKLSLDEGAVWVPFSVHKSEDSVAFFPAIFTCQPARTFRQENHSDKQTDRWYHLKALVEINGRGQTLNYK